VDHPAGQKERDERMWTALVDVGPSVSMPRREFVHR
jgi:Niemann-Pick C1 protein